MCQQVAVWVYLNAEGLYFSTNPRLVPRPLLIQLR